VVALFVLAGPALALAGFVGQPDRPERFDAKHVTVQPAGEGGVRIREVVDQDFGDEDRHGYERIIPDDFGEPTEVVASSPDAPDDVSVTPLGGQTRIRIGDPDTTVTGQHRYELAYTLPDARLDGGELALDIISAGEELETRRFEIVVAGLELENPLCNVGDYDDEGGCTLERDGDVYRAVISPLDAGNGITIGGTIVGRTDPVEVAVPPIPERRDEPNRILLAAAMLPIGIASAAGVYAIVRRIGRNEVYAGGAADAAYGPTPMSPEPLPVGSPLPAPRMAVGAGVGAPAGTRLVADDQMDDLVTTEFVPPRGIEPWQGAVVLNERLDNETVGAWFSGLAARDVIILERDGDDVVLRSGPRRGSLDERQNALVDQLFGGRESFALGSYDADFARAWNDVRAAQAAEVAQRGWWRRGGPAGGAGLGFGLSGFVVIGLIWLFLGAGSLLTAVAGVFKGPLGAVLFAIAVPALAAYAMYRSLLAARSASGSAIALRAESFRRFLEASEGRHVEWAWKHGLVREYSAWAVALGAASAWERAMAASSVPPAEANLGGALLVYSMAPSFHTSYTAPSSSGSGGGSFGGGGFSGGSVGGGGGGGSSGSW
jgi:hypothetical protein